MALAGRDGARAEELLRNSVKHGTAVLGQITEAALRRALGQPAAFAGRRRLFTDAERERLAGVLAATNATAELLGRARIRLKAQREAAGEGQGP